MDDLERKLKTALERELAGIDEDLSPPRDGPRRVLARRAIAVLTTTLALVGGVVLGGWAVSAVVAPERSSGDRTLQPASGEPSPDNTPSWQGPEVSLASGRTEGQEWSVSAFRARFDKSEGTIEALCTELELGERATGSGVACTGGWGTTMEKDAGADVLLHIAPSLNRVAIYGRVHASVSSMSLDLSDGATLPVRVVSPPAELGVDYKFFIAFAEHAKATGELVGKDPGDNVLFRQTVEIPHIPEGSTEP